jgi:hypothetical protein
MKLLWEKITIKAADYAKDGISKYYTDADELINDPAIDAIYIATPQTHKYYGLKVALKICCIENRCHQLTKTTCEFLTKKIPLFVSYYRRSLPFYR